MDVRCRFSIFKPVKLQQINSRFWPCFLTNESFSLIFGDFLETFCEIVLCLLKSDGNRKKGQIFKRKKSLSLFTVVILEKLIFRQIIIVKLCAKENQIATIYAN